MHRTAVKKVVLEGVPDANDVPDRANRRAFDHAGNSTVNMMSAPGGGIEEWCTLLERRRG